MFTVRDARDKATRAHARAHARAHVARAPQWLAELARATHLHGNDAEIEPRREGDGEGGGGKRAEVR